MSKRIFIIPGFTHKPSDLAYRRLASFLRSKGFQVVIAEIDWKRRVMSDYVEQFKAQYSKYEPGENQILGFSFGAVIALISAADLRPRRLFLCSLSPCFVEDQKYFSKNDAKIIGKRRLKDFRNFSAIELAERVKTPTIVFCGDREAKRYPALIRRCRQTVEKIKNARLVMASNAPHDIAYPSYDEAIKKSILR